METGCKDVELFHLRLWDTKSTNEQHQCPWSKQSSIPAVWTMVRDSALGTGLVCGWRVGSSSGEGCHRAEMAWGRVQGIHERTDCEFLSKLSKHTQKSPFENLSYAPNSRLLHSWALWNLFLMWTHLYSQLVRPGEADLCLQRAPYVMRITELHIRKDNIMQMLQEAIDGNRSGMGEES